jgi:hypothetical protein
MKTRINLLIILFGLITNFSVNSQTITVENGETKIIDNTFPKVFNTLILKDNSTLKISNNLNKIEFTIDSLLIGENVSGTAHERIMTAHEMMLPWEVLEPILDNLDLACDNFDHQTVRNILLNAPTGFNPSDGISDLVWLERHKDKGEAPDRKVVTLASRKVS